MTENGTTNRNHNQGLDPPSFQLPQDWDESRYELWSVRVPVSFNVDTLDGKTLEVPPVDNSTSGQQATKMGSFDKDDSHYAVVSGHAVENESFRILVPQRNDDDDSSSDEEEKESAKDQNKSIMIPSSVRFSRHVNVVDGSVMEEIVDTDMAPRLEVAPTPNDPVRRAYASVPQKSGLKRRWMPPGVNATSSGVAVPLVSMAAATTSSSIESVKVVDGQPPSDKKKQKRDPSSPTRQTPEFKNNEVVPETNEKSVPHSSSKKDKAARKAQKKAKKEKKKKEKKKRKSES